ncbi:hypothetical protein [Guggenheimella bovis]
MGKALGFLLFIGVLFLFGTIASAITRAKLKWYSKFLVGLGGSLVTRVITLILPFGLFTILLMIVIELMVDCGLAILVKKYRE